MKYPKELSACFTGHRIVKRDFDPTLIDGAVVDLIKKGYRYFFIGMALGFDSLSFMRVNSLKKRYPDIKIIACVPCRDQSFKFPDDKKLEYKKMLSLADEVIVLSDAYTPTCMKRRNEFMVDNSSVCISYVYRSSGGAYSTTKYALDNGLQVIYLK